MGSSDAGTAIPDIERYLESITGSSTKPAITPARQKSGGGELSG